MGDGMPNQRRFDWMDEALRPHSAVLDLEWDRAREAEVRRRSLFAQLRINPDGVAAELDAMRAAIGSGADTERFMKEVLLAHGAVIRPERDPTGEETATVFDLREVPAPVRDALVVESDCVKARFEPPGSDTTVVWSRTHPSVSGLAGHVLDTAFDPVLSPDAVAARCGVMRTDYVARRTTLLLCRSRMTIATRSRQGPHHMLAEEALLLAFRGGPRSPKWLSSPEAEDLLSAIPSGNVWPGAARDFVGEVLSAEGHWRGHVRSEANRRADALADSHAQVRSADRRRIGAVARGPGRGSGRVLVSAQHPTDVLGIYVFLPAVV